MNFTTDKELNNLTNGLPFYVIIYRSYKLLKTVSFLDHPVLTVTLHQLQQLHGEAQLPDPLALNGITLSIYGLVT